MLMRKLFRVLFGKDDAQDLAEYGIALAVVASFAVALAVAIAGDVQTLWSNADVSVSNVVNGIPPN
jgi:hypothetical protein